MTLTKQQRGCTSQFSHTIFSCSPNASQLGEEHMFRRSKNVNVNVLVKDTSAKVQCSIMIYGSYVQNRTYVIFIFVKIRKYRCSTHNLLPQSLSLMHPQRFQHDTNSSNWKTFATTTLPYLQTTYRQCSLNKTVSPLLSGMDCVA